MSTKWQKVSISIPDEFGSIERQAIATEILDFIRERTQSKNLDKNNKPFAKYSDEYAKSLDFKIAGKSRGDINLTLSGDMLGAMDLIEHKRGKVTIGFDKGSPENARADGNIRGTYGKPKPIGPKRDFLGISPSDLRAIIEKYQTGDSLARAESVLAGNGAGDTISTDNSEDDDG